MEKVLPVSVENFKKLYPLKEVDLSELGLFDEADFREIEESFGYLRGQKRLSHLIRDAYLLLNNPLYYLRNIRSIVSNQFRDWKKYDQDAAVSLGKRYPLSDYSLKASIAEAFKPKTFLEIGTWYGWGAASFKVVLGDTICYTINIRETAGANNPLEISEVGRFYRRKGLDIHQLWGDSRSFDFSHLGEIDVIYIDGNHEYAWVYADLKMSAKAARRAVILDDYLPSAKSPRGGVRAYGSWNESVTRAVDDFLKENPSLFSQAYWLVATPICVLVK